MAQSVEKLQEYKAKLDFICQNYDPFNQKEDLEVEKLIQELQLQDFLNDPFEFTNHLLQLLDKTQSQIKRRLQ